MRFFSKGFSLAELVIGMVLLAMACAGGITILMSQSAAFSDPLMHQTSLQIGSKIIHEIQIRSFDENSDPDGGTLRCGETIDGVSGGSCSTELGFDINESSFESFNDVDDFITSKLCALRSDCTDNFIPASFFYDMNNESEDWKNALLDYSVKIDVSRCSYNFSTDGTLSCSGSGTDQAKLVDVAVKQKDGNVVHYTFIRSNI